MNVEQEKDDQVDAETKRQILERTLAEKEQRRQQAITINKRDSAPVLSDLAEVGFQLEWVSDLYSKGYLYKDAIPILLDWLPRIDNLDVKEMIVRALSVTWAKPIAAPVLIREFLQSKTEPDTGLRWTIANALSVVADDSVYDEIVNLVRDPQYGRAREMLAVSLSNMKNPEVEGVLIDLLSDEVVVGHAIIALGKLRSQKAYQKIKHFLKHPKSWVRKEAKKALNRIEKLGRNPRSRK